MLADIAFTYHITLVDEETFIHQDWYPALYTISYIMYVVGLIWYNKISSIMTTNIQKTMDKKLPVMKTLWKKDSSNANYTDTNNEYTENLNEHKEIYQK